MAHSLAVRPSVGPRTWTVIDEDYRTVAPVEEWLEAHRHLWSPNTVRGLRDVAGPVVDVPRAARRGRAVARGRGPGGVGVPVLVAQRPHGRARPGRAAEGAVGGDLGGPVGGADLVLPLAGGRVRGAGRGTAAARDTAPQPGPGPAGPPGLALGTGPVRAGAGPPSPLARAATAAAAPGDPGRPRRLRRPRRGDRRVGRATCATGCCSRCWPRPAVASARCWACGSATS